MPDYAELHCLSNFTFLRGASHPHELVERAQALGYRALALTDECSMAGVVRAHATAERVGLQLIVGTELLLSDGPKLVLLAENQNGYSAICGLITDGRRAADKGSYLLQRSQLQRALPGVLVLWIPGATAQQDAEAAWVAKTFTDRAWIAFERHRAPDDAQRLQQLRALGQRHGLPLTATGDVHMHARGRRALQDMLTSVRVGIPVARCGQRLYANGERHLRARETLAQLYPPDLLAASVAIAARCKFSLKALRYEYPHELVPAKKSASVWLRELTENGMQRRWPSGAPASVRTLIEKELRLIAELRYEHFFLTVHDIVAFARSRGILCQGRGSAANSAVCYALGITEVDPARMNLLFERFISKERNEPPDIDVDFEHQRREEVIQYIYNKYGRSRAALAATVICWRARSAVRDVGKALGLSPDQVDRLARSLAWWDSADAFAQRVEEAGLDPEAPVTRQLFALVHEVQGFPRHLSQHVGGFVISEAPLSQLVPVENAAMPERTIIQWDKDDLETLGLLKVDCLALGMLSAIHRALDLVTARRGTPFTMQDVPAEDPQTYAMIGRAETTGVFQIESRAQMTMLPRLQPRTFYDLVIEVAIIRPGPILGKMVHPYLRRRQGLEAPDYPKPLERVLGRTLGIPIFQEQVMEIAMVAAGFTAGEADQVRRSMAAWSRHGGLEHFRDRLLGGMKARGYAADFAENIYQMVLGFGAYGFPESHAASFALLAYVSSWLKCHEPAAFFAALINSQPMGFYPVASLLREARRMGVTVRAIDVQHSHWDCTLEGAALGEIRLGLCLVKGLPETAAQKMLQARKQQPFRSVDDLVHRAGLDVRARRLLASADALLALSGNRHAARWAALGVEDLPGMLAGHSAAEAPAALATPREGAEIVADYASTGFSLRRHPLALLRRRLAKLRAVRSSDLPTLRNDARVTVAGLTLFRQRPQTASGVVFVSLEDEAGTINLIIWPKVVEAQRRAVLGARLMVVTGRLQCEQGVTHVIAEQVRDHSDWLGELPGLSRDFH